jgi:hypothetical protein
VPATPPAPVVTQPAPAPAQIAPLPPSQSAPLAQTDVQQGLADRQSWEQWFDAQTGEYQAGAALWASERNNPNPTSCALVGGAAAAGCLEAKRRLDASDYRRKTTPAYKQGWNSYTPSAPAAAAPAPEAAAPPSKASEAPAAAPPPVSHLFGAADLPAIIDTSQHNEVRFNRDYAGRAFRATLPFDSVAQMPFSSQTYIVHLGGIFS